MTSDFVKNRSERVEIIKGEYEGIQVPRSAIRFKELEETSTNVLTGEETTTKVNYRGVYVMTAKPFRSENWMSSMKAMTMYCLH